LPGLLCLRGVRGEEAVGREEGGNGVVRDLGVLIKSGVDGRSPQAWGRGAEPWTRRQEEDVFSFEILKFWKHACLRRCLQRFYIGFPCTVKILPANAYSPYDNTMHVIHLIHQFNIY